MFPFHYVVVGVRFSNAEPSSVLMPVDIFELQVVRLFTFSLNIPAISPG